MILLGFAIGYAFARRREIKRAMWRRLQEDSLRNQERALFGRRR